jgi:hypothetical protein
MKGVVNIGTTTPDASMHDIFSFEERRIKKPTAGDEASVGVRKNQICTFYSKIKGSQRRQIRNLI